MLSATYSELLKKNKNFRRLWMGQVISELGTWFSFIAELGLVRLFSGSPLATTALLVARLLPYFLVAPVAGVLVDRRSRKQIMIAADLLRALIALAYVAAASFRSVGLVVACSVMMSSLTMFFEGAKNAAMPNLVTGRELLTANVMMYSTRFLQLTLGAALGGVTAAQFGYDIAFIVNSISFVVSAAFILLIPASGMCKVVEEKLSARARAASGGEDRSTVEAQAKVEAQPPLPADPASADAVASLPLSGSEQPARQEQGRFISDIREGLAYVWATPFVRAVVLVNIGWATGGGMNNLLYDRLGGHTFARGGGDNGDWGVATLYTAAGAGIFLGMILIRRIAPWIADERKAGHFIGWALVIHGLFFAASGLMPSLALVALWVGASRLVIGMEFGVQETMMMRVLPDEYRGRVFTTDRSLEIGMMTVSMVVAGWLLTWFSPRTMMVVSGLLSATPGVVWLLALWATSFRVPARAVRESYGD